MLTHEEMLNIQADALGAICKESRSLSNQEIYDHFPLSTTNNGYIDAQHSHITKRTFNSITRGWNDIFTEFVWWKVLLESLEKLLDSVGKGR